MYSAVLRIVSTSSVCASAVLFLVTRRVLTLCGVDLAKVSYTVVYTVSEFEEHSPLSLSRITCGSLSVSGVAGAIPRP